MVCRSVVTSLPSTIAPGVAQRRSPAGGVLVSGVVGVVVIEDARVDVVRAARPDLAIVGLAS